MPDKLLMHARIHTYILILICVMFIIISIFTLRTLNSVYNTSNTINEKISEMDAETLNRALDKYASSDNNVLKTVSKLLDLLER